MTEQNNKIVDKHVGLRMRDRRKALGLTQENLAQMIGISHQQVQRYESGENPLSLSRTLEIANVLNVKPDYFYEQLPKPKAHAHSSSDGVIHKDRSRVLKILLVEDSATDETLFRKAVLHSGVEAEVQVMQTPEKVMSFLKAEAAHTAGVRPDILILDINMPRMNGLELLRKLKADAMLRTLPVIMLTNSIRAKDMLSAYANHASGFIQKNGDLDEYYRDIDRILQYWSRTIVLPSAA